LLADYNTKGGKVIKKRSVAKVEDAEEQKKKKKVGVEQLVLANGPSK